MNNPLHTVSIKKIKLRFHNYKIVMILFEGRRAPLYTALALGVIAFINGRLRLQWHEEKRAS